MPKVQKLSKGSNILNNIAQIEFGKYFGLGIILTVLICALFAPLISPYPPNLQSLEHRLIPPMSEGHILGTDFLGRDMLSLIIWGSRISILVGLVGTLLGAIIGVIAGLLSGYYGRWVDTIIMRLGDIQLAFPFILLALAIMSVRGPGIENIILVAVISGWIKYTRVIRANVMAVREEEYIQAGRALGLSDIRLIFRHIMPNVMGPVIVIATIETGQIIVMEAALSFLGMGVPPSTPTWGVMLSDSRTYMLSAPWLTIFPGLALTLIVLGVNMFGDWLRDRLDPKMNSRRG